MALLDRFWTLLDQLKILLNQLGTLLDHLVALLDLMGTLLNWGAILANWKCEKYTFYKIQKYSLKIREIQERSVLRDRPVQRFLKVCDMGGNS